MITKHFLLITLIFFTFISCSQYNKHINSNYKTKSSLFSNFNSSFDNLDNAIAEISDQLLLNIQSSVQKNNKIVITTFVDLNEFTKTSPFGRALSEGLIDELHTRHFKLLDFRAMETISVNQDGEFTLTRDILKLRDEMPEALIVVGTYTLLEDNLIAINTRIINNFTADVMSTSKVIYEYEDCKKFKICEKKVKKVIVKKKIVEKKKVKKIKKVKKTPFIEDNYL